MQLGIAGTGNYGFFNFLTLVLCVPLLDDGVLSRLRMRLASVRPRRRSRASEPETPARRAIVRVVAPVLLALSALSMVRELAYTLPGGRGMAFWPRAGDQVLGWVAPLRSINGYGLFRVMTTERPELVIEGSRDGERWEAYELRYKPGAVDRRPRFVAPFHPRLDWQLWFAALDPMGSYRVARIAGRRTARGDVRRCWRCSAGNPFPGAPPRFVRAVLYDYRFSTPEERRRTGAWWVRELEGTIPLGTAGQQ